MSASDRVYPAQRFCNVMLSKTLIYLVSSFLSSSLCLWHSSHSPLLLSSLPHSHQLLLIALPLWSHFCLSNTSPSVFFFLSMSVFVFPRPPSSSSPKCYLVLNPVCVKIPTLTTPRFVLHLPVSLFFLLPFPPLPLLPATFRGWECQM